MNNIRFKYVIPQVFASREQQDSELWQQDVVFERGKIYLVEADSGRGKSTFCSYVVGHRHDYSGEVLFDDRDVRLLTIPAWTTLRQRHVSYLFQDLRLFPELTAMENVEIKNRLTGFHTREQIETWFDMLGIPDKKSSLVSRMSFGQQQRVALIRALVQPFDFLLADEPISHLDDQNATIMGEILLSEARRQGAAVIVTSIGRHFDIAYDHTIRL